MNSGVDMQVHKLIGAQAHLTVFNGTHTVCSSLSTCSLSATERGTLCVVASVDVLSESAFTASGNVSFGSTRHKPHVLRFSTNGPARVLKLKDGEREFSAQFQVHEGEAEFQGAQGIISTFAYVNPIVLQQHSSTTLVRC